MNGSGTSADPFIITNVAQFCEMSPEYHYALDADIDFSSTPYSSRVSGITLGCSLNGRGHKVRNIVCNDPTTTVDLFLISGDTTITDTIFENIRLTGKKTAFFSGTSGDIILRRCSFALKSTWLDNYTNSDCVFNSGVSFNALDCNFVMFVSWTKQRILFRNSTLTRCQIRFTMKADGAKGRYDSYCNVLYNCTLSSCTFFGDFTVQYNDIMLFSNNSTFIGCCLRIAAHGTFQFWWLDCAIPSVSTADRSGMESTVSTSISLSGNMRFITTEQMQSADYLYSIGIDCVEVDE